MIQRGIYQHHKGAHYFVLGVGKLHDQPHGEYVIYTSTKAEDEHRLLLRHAWDFVAEVQWPDGVIRPRFVLERY